MKVVIVAAGMGIRLGPVTKELPKGLIEFGGKTLLERSLEAVAAHGLTRAVIVVGFEGERIRRRMGDAYAGIEIAYVENPEFADSGSMYSLSQAEGLLDEDILLLESDLLYDRRAIGVLMESRRRDAILMADPLNSGDDVYLCVDAEMRVTNLGKRLPDDDRASVAGCLVGVSIFSREFLSDLFAIARQDYSRGERNYHYEECVLKASRQGRPVHAVYCPGLNWIEIDNQNDLRRAQREIYPRLIGEFE
jgi:2-aminoethylphosphonate-pyruvate transaminase